MGKQPALCSYHHEIYGIKYENSRNRVNRYCHDPLKIHKTKQDKNLIGVTEQTVQEFKNRDMGTHIGQKICRSCKAAVFRLPSNARLVEVDHDFLEESETPTLDLSLESVNSQLRDYTSPIKKDSIMKLPTDRRSQFIKAKAETAAKSLRQKVLATAMVPPSPQKESPNDIFLHQLKNKIRDSSKTEQTRLLTLAPDEWSRAAVQSYFLVSERQVNEARAIKKDRGILGEPAMRRKGNKPLPENIEQAVIQFYREGEFVRTMPGTKQVISSKDKDGHKVYEAQRLLMGNLKELYDAFIKTHPDMKDDIKLAKFCALRPKYCKFAGSSGSHSVCVCTIHQNVKLMVEKVPDVYNYRELIEKVVCSVDNSVCMLRKCTACPGKDGLVEYLEEVFYSNYGGDPDDRMNYTCWVSTDRSNIEKHTCDLSAFIDTLADKVDKLTPHHHIARVQSAFLSSLKEKITHGEAIVIMDFAENYSFVVQDASQSFHWNNLQATLHPAVVYFRQNDTLQHKSIVVISDHMKHNNLAVYSIIDTIMPTIKSTVPELKHIHFFTDGCGGQYKNYKMFYNMAHMESDYGVTASWHFFATSHGKNACDGIGATVKYQARRASLQRISDNHITTPRDLYNFTCSITDKIVPIWLPSTTIQENQGGQDERMKNASTIGGTRDCHNVTVSGGNIILKRTSECARPMETHQYMSDIRPHQPQAAPETVRVQPGAEVAFIYDDDWYVGTVLEVSELEGDDVKIKSLSPKGPAASFIYPSRDDVFWAPVSSVVSVVELLTTTFRSWSISPEATEEIKSK